MRLNVCRLCLSCEELIWVYDKDNIQCDSSTDFQEIVYLTSGVKILAQDMISQKICKGCQNIIMTIWKFRTKSIEMDTFLKDELERYLRGGKLKIPNTETILRYNEGVTESLPLADRSIKSPAENPFQDQNTSLREVPEVPFRIEHCETVIVDDEDDNMNNSAIGEPLETRIHYEGKEEELDIEHTNLNSTSPNTTVIPNSIISQATTPLLPTTMLSPATMILPTTMVPPGTVILPTPVPPATMVLTPTIISSTTIGSPNTMVSPDRETPMDTGTIPEASEELEEQSEPYTCDICSHIVGDGDPSKIRTHRRRHVLRCKYCRKGYVGTKILNNHIENRCHYRKALISNPVVVVRRMDENSRLKKKYPNAFRMLITEQSAKKSTSTRQEKPPSHVEKKRKKFSRMLDEPHSRDKIKSNSDSNRSSLHVPTSSSKCSSSPVKQVVEVRKSAGSPSIAKNSTPKLTAREIKRNIGATLKKKYSTSTIKPNIGINSNTIIDKFESTAQDIDVAKYLISNLTTFENLDKATQTLSLIPTVMVRNSDEVVLKNIRLNPEGSINVETKIGNMAVKYQFDSKPEVKKKSWSSWDDLDTVDIVPTTTIEREIITLQSILASQVVVPACNGKQSQYSVGEKPLSRCASGRRASKDMPVIDNLRDSTIMQVSSDFVESHARRAMVTYATQNGQINPGNGQDPASASWPTAAVSVPQPLNSGSSTSSLSSQHGSIRVKPLWELSY